MLDPARSEITKRRLLPGATAAQEPKQRRLMVVALILLVVSLAFVLYRDRDFWFPDAEEAADRPLEAPTTFAEVAATPGSKPATIVRKKVHLRPTQPVTVAPVVEDAAPPLTVTRTVLPPLEIEVVAGTVHRTVRPGSNSVRVDMQPEVNTESEPPKPSIQVNEVPVDITTSAAERRPVATDSTSVVSHSVQPGYPVLARQMKVQGAVTLQALIGRDGLIQDLHVLSGPPILAKAALEAVRQWHFKPHYQGAETVETEAKITVNFTISTN
jgi:TonB family protein